MRRPALGARTSHESALSVDDQPPPRPAPGVSPSGSDDEGAPPEVLVDPILNRVGRQCGRHGRFRWTSDLHGALVLIRGTSPHVRSSSVQPSQSSQGLPLREYLSNAPLAGADNRASNPDQRLYRARHASDIRSSCSSGAGPLGPPGHETAMDQDGPLPSSDVILRCHAWSPGTLLRRRLAERREPDRVHRVEPSCPPRAQQPRPRRSGRAGSVAAALASEGESEHGGSPSPGGRAVVIGDRGRDPAPQSSVPVARGPGRAAEGGPQTRMATAL